jgi:hypothetical protein
MSSATIASFWMTESRLMARASLSDLRKPVTITSSTWSAEAGSPEACWASAAVELAPTTSTETVASKTFLRFECMARTGYGFDMSGSPAPTGMDQKA